MTVSEIRVLVIDAWNMSMERQRNNIDRKIEIPGENFVTLP